MLIGRRKRRPADGERVGPGRPGGINRVQFGCGPHNARADWWNVDIRPFPRVDEVLDATEPWPWSGLDYVYGEHFLEHLALDHALLFFAHAGRSLRSGGTLRLSTPNLEWVVRTHFAVEERDPRRRTYDTLRLNRAFRGWGHQFLWSEAMLRTVLEGMRFTGVRFVGYGESGDPELAGLERHGNYHVTDGCPSVVVVEAVRGDDAVAASPELLSLAEEEFLRHVRLGH